MLYIFLGNASGRAGDLDAAERAYDHAHALNPDYARALLGQAEIRFQRSKGQCEADHVDADGLTASLAGCTPIGTVIWSAWYASRAVIVGNAHCRPKS